jgi:hypothetical protein
MFKQESHISDQDLMMAVDGEFSRRRNSEVRRHLAHCWTCRSRTKELEETITDFVRVYHDSLDPNLPSSLPSRALLKARLSELAMNHPQSAWQRMAGAWHVRRFAYVLCTFVFAVGTLVLWQSSRTSLASNPNPRLTPGVALPLTEAAVCSTVPTKRSHAQLAIIGKEIFEKYGIRDPEHGHYELDYLIDPDLGGSDDARNLWPQPYSASWNAHVKDALEAHLRELVCTGKLTLAEAQHDIAADWIAAYKKYFHADHPLPDHLTFEKDEPWIN